MKRLLLAHPEVAGFALGLLDAVPRALAAITYAPSKAKLFGPLLIGNVLHVNGVPKAFGMATYAWFGIGAVLLAVLYGTVRTTGAFLRVDEPLFAIARALFGAIAGTLALNVAEATLTGKVTNYFGLAYGSRFTAINGGDVLVFLCVAAIPFATVFAFVLPLARARVP